jgi:hypothetical protein
MKKITKITAALLLTTTLALGGCASAQSSAAPAAVATSTKVFTGIGQTQVFRVGPGKDHNGGQIYSLSIVTASAIFDKDGKVVNVTFDGQEILSPNDTEHVGAPVFSGWPTQPGYLGGTSNTDETAAKEVSAWQTKRERGDKAYGMNWSEQFAVYQNFFKGKTVAEIEQWYAKNTSDVNGRPLTEKMTNEKDKAKYAALSDAEKKALADVTSGATISLKDAHGDFVGALKEAFANKVEVTIK